jgi:WhiB family redox-sensing transcriptional regulator
MSSEIEDFYDSLAEIYTATWRSYANCTDHDVRYFSEEHHVAEGKRICSGCSVKVECLDSALYYNDGFLRGGLTESERNSVELHRKRHLASFRYDIES